MKIRQVCVCECECVCTCASGEDGKTEISAVDIFDLMSIVKLKASFFFLA